MWKSFDWLPEPPWQASAGLVQPKPRQLRPLTASSVTPSASQQAPSLNVEEGDRWAILGTSGTGKTTFAKRLLRELARLYPECPLYVLDSKQAGDFRGWGTRSVKAVAPGPIARGLLVWAPPDDNPDAYDRWLNGILRKRKPAILLIDELSSLGGKKGDEFPLSFSRLLKQGRGLGITSVTLSQEAAYIPRNVIGQATHVVRFGLQSAYDERAVDRFLWQDGATHAPASEHGFLYRRLGSGARGRTFEYSGFREFFE